MSKAIFKETLTVYTDSLQSMMNKPQKLMVGESRIVHAVSNPMNPDRIDIWFEDLNSLDKEAKWSTDFVIVTDDFSYNNYYSHVATVIARTGAVYHILRRVNYYS